jgi:2-octaprenyl-6-methoxyphenol hydroxylase
MKLDLVIVGGGLVGATLALALARSGLSLGLIEARALDAPDNPAFDDRAIALAQGSVQILERLGIWSALAPRAVAIRQIHVSDRGHFGLTRLDAARFRVPALGQVALGRDIGALMSERLTAQANLQLFCPGRLRSFSVEPDRVEVELEGGQDRQGSQRLACRLLVAADGAQSQVRRQLGIGQRQWSYGQSAIIASIRSERPHEGVAYERFTDSGPLALLPMPSSGSDVGQRMALVWTAWDRDLAALLALDDRAFVQALQARFGWRQGRILEVGPRSSYPLGYLQAQTLTRPRVALVGNAAHLLHPIAGQGFNLGLRDLAELARLVERAAGQGADIGGQQLLDAYVRARWLDQQQTGLLTDALVRLFSNALPGLGVMRGLGLAALDALPPAKHLLGQRAMGLLGGGLIRS